MKKRICLFMVFVIIFNVLPMANVKDLRAENYTIEVGADISDENISEFACWMMGFYQYKTMEYTAHSNYLCLKKCYSFVNGMIYNAVIPEGFRFIVRELDEDLKYVRTVTVYNRQSYSPGEDTKYITIILNNCSQANITYEDYKELFELEEINLVPEMTGNNLSSSDIFSLRTDDGKWKLDEYDFSDVSNWQTGYYAHLSMNYVTNYNKICLKKYLAVDSGLVYDIVLPEEYSLILREMNDKGEFIRTIGLYSNSKYVASDNAEYVAVNFTHKENAHVTFDQYMKVLENDTCFIRTNYIEEKDDEGILTEENVIEETNEESIADNESIVDKGNENDHHDIVTDETDCNENDEVITEVDTDDSKNGIMIEEHFDNTILENINVNDVDNWMPGFYEHNTGKYISNNNRICLNEYKKFVKGNVYDFVLPEEYSVVIRELDAENNFLRTVVKYNGNEYTPQDKCVYLAISLIVSNNSYVGIDKLKEQITNKEIVIIPRKGIEGWDELSDGIIVIDRNDKTIINNININDLMVWGKEIEKVCPEKEDSDKGVVLQQNVRFKSGMSMEIEIDESYKMVVNELDDVGNVLRKINIYDGGSYSPSKYAYSLNIAICTSDGSTIELDKAYSVIKEMSVVLK